MKRQSTKTGTTKKKVIDYQVDLMPPVLSQQEYQKLETEPCKCYACGSLYPAKNKFFSKCNSKLYAGNNYYLPICNACLDKLYIAYMNTLGDKEQALRRICMSYDIYYSKEISDVVDGLSPKSYIKMYIDKSNLQSKSWANKTYANTIVDDENDFNRFTHVAADAPAPTGDDDVKDIEREEALRESVEFWGFGFTAEQYDMLNNNYHAWTSNYDCNQYSQIVSFKTMSMMQMRITMGIQNGDKVDALMKQLNDYMGSLNIQARQKNQNTATDQLIMGKFIERIEKTDPVPDPEPTWLEKMGIIRYISVWFLGHFAKMMGLKNTWSKLYEEEIAKYTVKPPVYEEDGTDDISFEDLFGSHREE